MNRANYQRRNRQKSTLGGLVARGYRFVRGWLGLVLFAAGAVASFAQGAPDVPALRILVGPNVLVSQEPAVAHVEPWVATHPSDPSKLIAMATTHRDIGGVFRATLYASNDGGYTWTGPMRPHLPQYSGQDPIVGYGLHGTAYAVSLVSGPGGSAMWVYRSEDPGLTWNAGVRMRQADHPRLAVDYGGKYAGRAYLAAEGREDPSSRTNQRRAAFVWRSTDDGRTWLGPVVAAQEADLRINVSALQVLSDGTVAVFMLRLPPSADMSTPTQEILLSTSTDGGATFSPARAIGKLDYGGRAEVTRRRAAGRFDADASVSFDAAVDTRSTRYHDRLYVLHAERRARAVGNRLVLSYSTDRGITWSAPKEVAPETDSEAGQFHSAIAVNLDGSVGVFWYDTRDLVGRDQWHTYFSASLNGGDTFLPAVRVSKEPSTPFTADNHRPLLMSVQGSPKGVNVSMRSAFARFPNGGDYVGLTADAAGVFHPVWSDSRTGSFQLYTSRIHVVREGGPGETTVSGGARPTQSALLNDRVTLALDPARLDMVAGEMLIPVRLKNTSNDTLYGPITVEIVRLEAPFWSSEGAERDRTASVELLNASNGLSGKGARIEYAAALRDLSALLPGAVSEAIVWRVKPPSLQRTLGIDIEAVITGYVAVKPGNAAVR